MRREVVTRTEARAARRKAIGTTAPMVGLVVAGSLALMLELAVGLAGIIAWLST